LTEAVREHYLAADNNGENSKASVDDIALLESFYLSRLANGCTEATLAYYTDNLLHLLRFAHSIGKTLGSLERADITHYIVTSSQSRLSAASVNMRIRALRAFYNYLSDPELHSGCPLLAVNPAARVKEMKADRRERNIATPEQVEHLLKTIPPHDFTSSRNRNLILTLWDTGIRSGELCGILTEDVDFRQGVIHIRHSKARRHRLVPTSDRTTVSLHTYFSRYRKNLPGNWFFCFRDGKPMTVDRLHRIVYDLCNKVGMHTPPKDWRHTFVTHYLLNGGNPVICQHITGHSDIRLIMTYEHTEDSHAKIEHNRCSPANGLKH
jgi:site-specific recombinase XerD